MEKLGSTFNKLQYKLFPIQKNVLYNIDLVYQWFFYFAFEPTCKTLESCCVLPVWSGYVLKLSMEGSKSGSIFLSKCIVFNIYGNIK